MEPVALEDAHDLASLGGKAVQLGASLRGGLPVPGGFALPTGIVERVAHGDRAARSRCVTVFERMHPSRVAVRSSAVGEDGHSASFAGQHVTRLSVAHADAFIEAIVAVWQSAHADAALAYRAKLGLAGRPAIGVVVQRMVDAECAGVMFTRNPVTGEDVRVVEAAWGLGESVVSGAVDPDRIQFARGGRILEHAVGNKEVAVRPHPHGSTHEVEVDSAARRLACLDEARIRALDELALRCDQLFADGAAHDIEFAFERSVLFLLQRRPVTR